MKYYYNVYININGVLFEIFEVDYFGLFFNLINILYLLREWINIKFLFS